MGLKYDTAKGDESATAAAAAAPAILPQTHTTDYDPAVVVVVVVVPSSPVQDTCYTIVCHVFESLGFRV
jgi:hypothetical protein